MTSLIEDWEAQKQDRSKTGKIKIVGVIPESFSQDYVANAHEINPDKIFRN
jgi:hypothetical protein